MALAQKSAESRKLGGITHQEHGRLTRLDAERETLRLASDALDCALSERVKLKRRKAQAADLADARQDVLMHLITEHGMERGGWLGEDRRDFPTLYALAALRESDGRRSGLPVVELVAVAGSTLDRLDRERQGLLSEHDAERAERGELPTSGGLLAKSRASRARAETKRADWPSVCNCGRKRHAKECRARIDPTPSEVARAADSAGIWPGSDPTRQALRDVVAPELTSQDWSLIVGKSPSAIRSASERGRAVVSRDERSGALEIGGELERFGLDLIRELVSGATELERAAELAERRREWMEAPSYMRAAPSTESACVLDLLPPIARRGNPRDVLRYIERALARAKYLPSVAEQRSTSSAVVALAREVAAAERTRRRGKAKELRRELRRARVRVARAQV